MESKGIARDPDLCRTKVAELTISNLTIGETLEGDYVIYKIIQTCTLGLLCAPNLKKLKKAKLGSSAHSNTIPNDSWRCLGALQHSPPLIY